MHAHIHTQTCTCTHTHTQTCMHTPRHRQTCMHTYTYTHTHKHIQLKVVSRPTFITILIITLTTTVVIHEVESSSIPASWMQIPTRHFILHLLWTISVIFKCERSTVKKVYRLCLLPLLCAKAGQRWHISSAGVSAAHFHWKANAEPKLHGVSRMLIMPETAVLLWSKHEPLSVSLSASACPFLLNLCFYLFVCCCLSLFVFLSLSLSACPSLLNHCHYLFLFICVSLCQPVIFSPASVFIRWPVSLCLSISLTPISPHTLTQPHPHTNHTHTYE